MYRTAGKTGVSPGGLISTHAKKRAANPVYVVFWMHNGVSNWSGLTSKLFLSQFPQSISLSQSKPALASINQNEKVMLVKERRSIIPGKIS